MNYKKTLIVVLIVLLLITSIPSYAHQSSQAGILAKEYINHSPYYDYYIGGTTVGWFINESFHTNGALITYKCAPSVDDDVIAFASTAASVWTGENGYPVTIQSNPTGTGTIQQVSLANNINAQCCQLVTSGTTGHLTSWKIQVNENNLASIDVTTLEHEFGHIIGLTDIYSTTNKNKIMYYKKSERTATAPASIEKKGAEVITGQHTSHTWEYVFYRTNSSGVAQHKRRCTYCKGIKYNSIENCTFNAYGVCTKCGHVNGSGTSGITPPEVTGMSLWDEQRRAFRFLI